MNKTRKAIKLQIEINREVSNLLEVILKDDFESASEIITRFNSKLERLTNLAK